MQEETLNPTLFLAIVAQNPYGKAQYTSRECIQDTLDMLSQDPRAALRELGTVALNDDEDTLKITRPFSLIGDGSSIARLEALKDIIEDLRRCGYHTTVTAEDELTEYTPITPQPQD